jgi:hypothetical protein
MARLLIFTPTYDNLLRPETVESVETQQFSGDVDWIINEENPYPGRDMRNVCVQFQRGRQMTLEGGYDAMLSVEHDMTLPPGAVQTLWDTAAPVVYAIYALRHGSQVVNLFRKEGTKNIGMSLSLFPDELKQARKQGTIEVSGAGFGCTLFRRDVLEAVPFRFGEYAPDIPFAVDCLHRGIVQMGRADVICGHFHNGVELNPWKGGGVIARVLALQDVTVNIERESKSLKHGRYYSIPCDAASELQRAGYLQIMNDIENTTDEREIAVAPVMQEREMAQVRKIKPRRRKVTADVPGDSD